MHPQSNERARCGGHRAPWDNAARTAALGCAHSGGSAFPISGPSRSALAVRHAGSRSTRNFPVNPGGGLAAAARRVAAAAWPWASIPPACPFCCTRGCTAAGCPPCAPPPEALGPAAWKSAALRASCSIVARAAAPEPAPSPCTAGPPAPFAAAQAAPVPGLAPPAAFLAAGATAGPGLGPPRVAHTMETSARRASAAAALLAAAPVRPRGPWLVPGAQSKPHVKDLWSRAYKADGLGGCGAAGRGPSAHARTVACLAQRTNTSTLTCRGHWVNCTFSAPALSIARAWRREHTPAWFPSHCTST